MTRLARRSLQAALLASVALALAGCQDDNFDPASQIGPNPVLPEPKQFLLPPMKIAEPVGWKPGETPTVAPGLKIQAIATGLKSPRNLRVLPNGDILVIESKGPEGEPKDRPKDIVMGWIMSFAHAGGAGGNRITLLRDTSGDGMPDQQTVFLEGLNSPFGAALVGSDLYVAETDKITRFPYQEGQTRIEAQGEKLLDLPGGPINHHWTKDLTASPDGSKLYASVGSNSNIVENGLEAEKRRAAIWEIDRATGASRIFASGLRNPNGLTFEPTTGALWAVINERDELGSNLVPDYMTSVKDGGFYGWPYSYYGQHLDPRVKPQRPDLVAQAIMPDYSLGSHVAPLGLAFASGQGLPPTYASGAFVGEHGSWDRTHFSGYKVVFVPFKDGKPSGPAQDVVTGFLTSDGKAHGRPVGVAIDKTGALLIADDAGGVVWRVTAGG